MYLPLQAEITAAKEMLVPPLQSYATAFKNHVRHQVQGQTLSTIENRIEDYQVTMEHQIQSDLNFQQSIINTETERGLVLDKFF
jgi:hypothetical protein